MAILQDTISSLFEEQRRRNVARVEKQKALVDAAQNNNTAEEPELVEILPYQARL